jgi:exopolyphosphatase/pppGpp-phosphohydrolase
VGCAFTFLGLFIDIGGGSASCHSQRCQQFRLFSLPLVRLTENFFSADPPRVKESKNLRQHTQSKLEAVLRRIQKEKFTMAFGSGGTVTALAETGTRAAGDGKAGSLIVLRRQRLKALLDLLMTRPAAERADMISGDPNGGHHCRRMDWCS